MSIMMPNEPNLVGGDLIQFPHQFQSQQVGVDHGLKDGFTLAVGYFAEKTSLQQFSGMPSSGNVNVFVF
jgi:hypothetical protein